MKGRRKERFLNVMLYDRVANNDKEPKMGKKKTDRREAKRNKRGGQPKNEQGNNEKTEREMTKER